MKRVLATAGHVDHGKSTLVRVLTGRDPDRLAEERARHLTIELGFAWTTLPTGADVAFVDVPGHQRFVGTTLAGLGPSSAVVFVVAADQGWQAQSSEHLAALQALGITDGLLVLTRCDLAGVDRQQAVRDEATLRLRAAGLAVPSCAVSAVTGAGMDGLRGALDDLVGRMSAPDPDAPVRLWCDRSFTIAGAGTVVTGTLAAGTLHTGDRLTLLSGDRTRTVVVRGLHSEDLPHDSVGPVSRVAVNLRRTETAAAGRASVLLTPGSYAVAQVVDTALEPVDSGQGSAPSRPSSPPARAVLHVGTAAVATHVRPLGAGHVRLTPDTPLPWQVGDRAILRDPGDRRLWALRVVDIDPLPLRRRGAARRRAEELAGTDSPTDTRLRSRGAEHPAVLSRLALPVPTRGVSAGPWWVDPDTWVLWRGRVADVVATAGRDRPLDHGIPVVEVGRALDLPEHLRPVDAGGSLPQGLPDPAPVLVRHLATAAGLTVTDGLVTDREHASLGPAEASVAAVEAQLRADPFAAPGRDELVAMGLGPRELAAAGRAGRLLRITGDVVLLPDGPDHAVRELATLEQPFTLSAARRALGTTRRVAVPLLEHLDSLGRTRRIDDQLRQVLR